MRSSLTFVRFQLLTEHKVLFFRGQTNVGTAEQLRLVQAMNKTWGLRAESEQVR